jgi:outer membrane protein OmpA-like peptidoglycan-associated protein
MLGIALVLIAVSTVGCCKEQEDQINALKIKNGELLTKNTTLQQDLAKAKSGQQDLMGQLESTDAELLAAKQENSRLAQELATARMPTTQPVEKPKPTRRGDWDVGAFADRVSLTGDILFSSGRATISAAGRARLARVVQTLKSEYAGRPIRVYGFTDSQRISRSAKLWTDNLDLSANRAMAVTRYLILRGIPASQIETVGMGMSRPVADNSTRDGRAKNRRVEIVVIKQ